VLGKTKVGTVVATDPDPGQTLTYALVDGGGGLLGDAFAIDRRTGVLRVTNAAALLGAYLARLLGGGIELTVQVTDDGLPPLSATATVRIHLTL
jgi:hypothetical protein